MEISDSPIPAAILIEREGGRLRRQWRNRHVRGLKAARHRENELALQAWVEGLAAPAEVATS